MLTNTFSQPWQEYECREQLCGLPARRRFKCDLSDVDADDKCGKYKKCVKLYYEETGRCSDEKDVYGDGWLLRILGDQINKARAEEQKRGNEGGESGDYEHGSGKTSGEATPMKSGMCFYLLFSKETDKIM